MSIVLTEKSNKLLELLHQNHGALYNKNTDQQAQTYLNITISAEQFNLISEGMAALASIIALNPSFKASDGNHIN